MQNHILQSNLTFGSGFPALFNKEIARFKKVFIQTVAAPAITTILYLVVFAQVLSGRVAYGSIPYVKFLIPGLMMMSMMQNAFSNSSSSFVQSKMSGNLVFILLPPISPLEIFSAYTLASVVRAFVVGFVIWLCSLFYSVSIPVNLIWLLVFSFLASATMGTLGLLNGVLADKWDQLANFQTFLIMPMTFLSGVFYSIHSLPSFWQSVSYYNPVFYMIDGFRYAFFRVSDVSPWHSFIVSLVSFLVISLITMRILQTGYKLRS
ncbi:ABC transporter permease [Taylorella equigenitalis]|uniref:ABC transporter permease n=1 Tax=Taylorella equigenitalis TaxID=29575 RepID=UPI00237E3253|nr:ABC transporter permease [Taylorella equigenitalis]WDU51748.1 ABC transporter permease [Taylorella equigenitalis]